MLDILTNIKLGIVTVAIATATLFGYVPQTQAPTVANEPMLGGTFVTPSAVGLFTTSLASKITSSDTSMTLVSAADKDGNALASSTYGFIIDEGTSVEEFVLADCTGTTCTNMTRGVSVTTATTSVAALKFEHRRGASVKITTHPAVVFAINVLKGRQNIENVLRYNSTQTFNNATDIISRDYADALSFGAVPAASETASGFVELATTLEGASSTSSGSAARLVIPASSATSTYNSATAALRAVVTQNNGKIDPYFIATSSLGILNNAVLTGTTTMATSTTYFTNGIRLIEIGKNIQVITTTGTSTFTVPSGVSKIKVEVVGGGGTGANGADLGGSGRGGGGGGGGGYSLEFIDVTATSSIQVFVGAAGEPTKFGTNGFYLSATAGTNGSTDRGGIGGLGSGGDFNSRGGYGDTANNSGGTSSGAGGGGGNSVYGGGGRGGYSGFSDGGTPGAGEVGDFYGGGGGGGGGSDTVAASGAAGAQGVIIVTW